MLMTDKLMGLSEKEKADYAESENAASQSERGDDEWDIDETSFADEGEITLDDLRNSPIYKAMYASKISASNWNEWILGVKKRCLA